MRSGLWVWLKARYWDALFHALWDLPFNSTIYGAKWGPQCHGNHWRLTNERNDDVRLGVTLTAIEDDRLPLGLLKAVRRYWSYDTRIDAFVGD